MDALAELQGAVAIVAPVVAALGEGRHDVVAEKLLVTKLRCRHLADGAPRLVGAWLLLPRGDMSAVGLSRHAVPTLRWLAPLARGVCTAWRGAHARCRLLLTPTAAGRGRTAGRRHRRRRLVELLPVDEYSPQLRLLSNPLLLQHTRGRYTENAEQGVNSQPTAAASPAVLRFASASPAAVFSTTAGQNSNVPWRSTPRAVTVVGRSAMSYRRRHGNARAVLASEGGAGAGLSANLNFLQANVQSSHSFAEAYHRHHSRIVL